MEHFFRLLLNASVWGILAWNVFVAAVPVITLLLALGITIMQVIYWKRKLTQQKKDST